MKERQVKIKDKNSPYWIEKLKPFKLGDWPSAMIFGWTEAERVLYLYGIEEDFEIDPIN